MLEQIKSVAKKYLQNSTVKASLGYTVGNYLLRGIGFITVPIFARLMTQEDFGQYNTFLAYEGIIYILISLALHVSIKNAKYEYGNNNLDSYTSSISIIPLLMLLVYCLILNIFPSISSDLLHLNLAEANLLLIYSYASGTLIFYQHRISLDYKYKEYLYLSYVNTFINIVLSVVLMVTVYSEKRYVARIIGSVVGLIVVTIYILWRLWNKSSPKFNREYWTFGLKLSIPIIPHGLGQIILLSFDRIMINKYVGAKEAGVYSFAYTILSIIQITSNSIYTAFEPWAYEQIKKENYALVKRRSANLFYLICAVTVIVILIAPEAILLLGSSKYTESIYCVIPVLVGGFFSMTYQICGVLTYYYKKTQYIAPGTIFIAILNIVLNYIFINKYGYIAAAYTTLVCYVLYFLYHYFIAYKASGRSMISAVHCFIGSLVVVMCGLFTFITLSRPILRLTVLCITMLGIVLYYARVYKINKG